MVFAQDGGDVGEHLAEIQLGQRHAVVLVDEGFDLGFEQAEIDAVLVAGPVEQHIGHGLGVAFDQAQQQVQEFFASAHREAPDHAEVDEGDAVVFKVDDVARVRVGVEKAVFDDLLEHGLCAAFRQQAAVQPQASSWSS
ncbi:hypothetical protein Y695_04215 [Hydrogenophaga sp. T4]|nr:hypothetical protein Y695_04215 [Hydrogenophaga sp. T4]